MSKDVIIACDFASREELMSFLKKLGEKRLYLKIGMELYYALGPQTVKELKERGHSIFLDLKLHDIPNTVGKSMKVLASLGVDMINLHAAGGYEMMKAAREGIDTAGDEKPLLIAVTQLTSISQESLEKELLIHGELEDVVAHYAKNAKRAGLDGVVCSPLEAKKVHRELGEGFLTVTPGIRFEDSKKDDQVRIMTPKKAREEGSDYIVVGRSITQAQDVKKAYEKCVKDFLAK